jgi:hypothetical protein
MTGTDNAADLPVTHPPGEQHTQYFTDGAHPCLLVAIASTGRASATPCHQGDKKQAALTRNGAEGRMKKGFSLSASKNGYGWQT